MFGVSRVAERIIAAIQSAVGTWYEPRRLRLTGFAKTDVEVDRIKQLSVARAEAVVMAEAVRNARELAVRSQDRMVSGDSSTKQLEQEILARAGARMRHVEIKREVQLNTILTDAIEQASQNSEDEPREIEDDWIATFVAYAQNVSHEQIRKLWTSVLVTHANESKPRIHRATLDALRLLEPEEAKLFERVVKLFLLTGQITTTRAVEELSFDVDTLPAMNLIDIGFLDRLETDDHGMTACGAVLQFLKPDIPANSGTLADVESHSFVDHSLKALRVDRCKLTSCGFELAAIIVPEFNQYVSGHTPLNPRDLGIKAKNPSERILNEWALLFSQRNVTVIRSRMSWTEIKGSGKSIHRKSVVKAESVFDARRKRWVSISA